MMKREKYVLRFITPCFCSGARQGIAEIRVPSIKGKLRWWFRALGGTRHQERCLFGGIESKSEAPSKTATTGPSRSKFTIRISDQKIMCKPNSLPKVSQGDPVSYMLYFAKASGDGVRLQRGGFIGPQSECTLHVIPNGRIESSEEELLSKAMDAFLLLGAIGLRANRCSGAFAEIEKRAELDFASFCEQLKPLQKNSFYFAYVCDGKQPLFLAQNDWKETYKILGKLLKDGYRQNNDSGKKIFSAGQKGEKQTPLGSANPRQASGLRLRPVLLKEGLLPLAFFTDQFLGPGSKSPAFDLLQSKSSECSIQLQRI